MSQPIEVSFEFFPPKTPEAEKVLWESVQRLAPLNPRFVSVTYGAGGSTRARTHAIVKQILDDTALLPAAHLTCAGACRDEISDVVQTYWDLGVRHIVALRGDAPGGPGVCYEPHPGGFDRTSELVAGIKNIADFDVTVSAYPEKHPDASSLDADIDALQAKVDAGADRAITQFFFDNDVYFRYLDKVRARGITIPIVPGILPVQNFNQTAKFAKQCGTNIPEKVLRRFNGLDDDAHTRSLVAAAVCAEQVEDLADRGVSEFHFYTMNRSNLVFAICHLLGIRPHAMAQAAE